MSLDTNLFQSFVAKSLNESQQRAVMIEKGPILVIAGAGSGKTRVITSRIANLMLTQKAFPSQVLALTFTNKAALEMKHRIRQFLGDRQDIPFVGTFHSYCVRLLKNNQELLDNPFLAILDEDDKKKLIDSILERLNLQKHISARNVLYQISHLKNRELNLETQEATTFVQPALYDIFQQYEAEKRAARMLDFDDLLLETLKIFKKHDSFKKDFQSRVRHILVDEYQDTNSVQHALLIEMAKHSKELAIDSICAVGDEDQSIYSWRGATIANMLNFQKDFKGTTLVKIEQNYRSVQSILDIANSVITHNTQRNPKVLWSDKKGSDRVRVLSFLSDYQESDGIAHYASVLRKQNPTATCAILYRTHAQSRNIEEALLKRSLPYKIIGGIQFYERKEIKDLLAYLKLVVNPFDRVSFFRVINTPTRGLGAKFEELAQEYWNTEPFLSFGDILHRIHQTGGLPSKKLSSLLEFNTIFEGLHGNSPAYESLETIINKTGYITYLKLNNDTQEAAARIENIQELLNAINHFTREGISSIQLFLDEVALLNEKMTSSESEHEESKILLMTLHAAKGLEFDTVILAGLEEGILPSSRSLSEDDALEEERRLFYVGITRARERLLLTHAKFRYVYGKMMEGVISRFLKEVPRSQAHFEECSQWSATQIASWFSAWIKGKALEIAPSPLHIPRAPRLAAASTDSSTFKTSTAVDTWKKNRAVSHTKYGTGLIQFCEKSTDGKIYVTVQFKTGTKKIISDFLTQL